MKTLAATVFLTFLSFILPQAWAAQITVSMPKSTDPCLPPAVVASFLSLTPAQAAQFADLLGPFETTLHGLQEQIAVRQAQLDTVLSQPSPDPATVGGLLLQIHGLQQQAAQAIQSFQSQFATLLNGEQKQKVQAVTQAAQLQPVVGAFVALNLAAAPTPLPCPAQ
jgi:Spy/CpxP family protein refolding chaperone